VLLVILGIATFASTEVFRRLRTDVLAPDLDRRQLADSELLMPPTSVHPKTWRSRITVGSQSLPDTLRRTARRGSRWLLGR